MGCITIPVSVIVTTYNRASFVLEAIQSILSQRYVKPLEIIVVDDGSTDETPMVLAQIREFITYIRKEHRGVSCARNRGIDSSRGEWIAFLDSDDLWLPYKLFRHWQFCLENPNILISQTDEIWLRQGVRLNPKKYHEKPEGYCFERLLERCLISPSAVMIHRSIFERVGVFDERIPACEDYDLWLRIGCRFPIGLIRKKLVVKRGGHPDQLSSNVVALDRFRIFAMVKLFIREELSDSLKEAIFKELSNKCKIYAHGALKRGKEEEYKFFFYLPSMIRYGIIKDEEIVLNKVLLGSRLKSFSSLSEDYSYGSMS
ncbi:MAG: glycosyltransferase [Syntrophobacterales bacterium]|nr:glycosyltransferase [Syntrophobacterales bacterium]